MLTNIQLHFKKQSLGNFLKELVTVFIKQARENRAFVRPQYTQYLSVDTFTSGYVSFHGFVDNKKNIEHLQTDDLKGTDIFLILDPYFPVFLFLSDGWEQWVLRLVQC